MTSSAELRGFDMIIIDEASQVRAMDALINLQCGDKDTRFLLVGDDNQLAPIISGRYRAKDGETDIYGSIFRMFYTALGVDHPNVVQLNTEFRMNGILCEYSKKLYPGEDYKPYDDTVKYQTISLNNSSKDKLINYILDPQYPLVFCELYGTPEEQKETEIGLVTKLVRELWDNLDVKRKDFWSEGCGLISPHHEHINRIRNSIFNELKGDVSNISDIYIDTVEKLQGKERQAVIVSYGVCENEKINNEKEFIFSMNRFNVSLTRGKAKTIVFLSEAISVSNIETNVMLSADDPELSKGIEFIQGFAKFMKEETKPYDKAPNISVYRKCLLDQPSSGTP